jgi:uncharacterized protein
MTQFNDPQPMPDVPVPTDAMLSKTAEIKPAAVAPWWHTLLIILLILGNSLLGSSKLAHAGGGGHGSRLLLYGSTFITELVLILLVWFGIRLRGVRMRDLIGGRWNTVEDFLLDIGLAVGFWIVSLALLFGLRVALGLINLHNLAKSTDETFRVLGPLAPRSYLEAGSFVALSIAAGLFEEIIFRGYLQRQFHALARNAALGIILSGIVFGLAHGYQGARLMVVIAVFGIFFGILAYLRKSLRPGMIAHAMQDSLAGIVLFLYFLRHH